jgi:hypothetical protein
MPKMAPANPNSVPGGAVDSGRRRVVEGAPHLAQRREELPGLIRTHLPHYPGRPGGGQPGPRLEPLLLVRLPGDGEQAAWPVAGVVRAVGGQSRC